MVKKVFGALLSAALATFASVALAIPVFEVGDAGDLPASAQILTGVGDITTISGTIQSPTDVDMYQIFVTGASPLLLQAATWSTIDSQIFLFNAAGFAVLGNDDLGTTLDASITASVPSGLYYVAISSWDRDPVNAANQEIFTDAGGVLQTPINGGGPVMGYSGVGTIGTYTIHTRGIGVIPEPQTWALVGAGLVAMFGRLLRRGASGL